MGETKVMREETLQLVTETLAAIQQWERESTEYLAEDNLEASDLEFDSDLVRRLTELETELLCGVSS
jgi:hypothetical protein